MTVSVQLCIQAFHDKYGISYNGPPRMLPKELYDFRMMFLEEELAEFSHAQAAAYYAIATGDTQKYQEAVHDMIDAMGDLIYVAAGTLYLMGGRHDVVFQTIHSANMKKVRAETAQDSKRGSTFDVVKPAGWKAPDHYLTHAKPSLPDEG
jgi:predicted HAD superfamily Cof-like phosphohydrolase